MSGKLPETKKYDEWLWAWKSLDKDELVVGILHANHMKEELLSRIHDLEENNDNRDRWVYDFVDGMARSAGMFIMKLEEDKGHYLHKCRKCNVELPWTDGTDTEYWCQHCGLEQPAAVTEVRWIAEVRP